MNRKLRRYLEDEERTAEKIRELQEHLAELKMLREQEENEEIIRRIRKLKLEPRRLYELVESLEKGRSFPEDMTEILMETPKAGVRPVPDQHGQEVRMETPQRKERANEDDDRQP